MNLIMSFRIWYSFCCILIIIYIYTYIYTIYYFVCYLIVNILNSDVSKEIKLWLFFLLKFSFLFWNLDIAPFCYNIAKIIRLRIEISTLVIEKVSYFSIAARKSEKIWFDQYHLQRVTTLILTLCFRKLLPVSLSVTWRLPQG